MKRYMVNIISLLLLNIAVALFSMGCELFEDPGTPITPIFAETELMDASYSEGQFYFSPSWDVTNIVLGIFNSQIVTSGKRIVNMVDMEGGSCTGQLGFTRSWVPEGSLYTYDDALMFFNDSLYDPFGEMFWAVWGFNADWDIISSSEQITTVFP